MRGNDASRIGWEILTEYAQRQGYATKEGILAASRALYGEGVAQ